MKINKVIDDRGIKEILHFTTNSGLTGILHSGKVKSRKRLSGDKYLEYILKLNCQNRSKDEAWIDYVNLSITSVNSNLFKISKDKWHAPMDGFWCIMSFNPDILTHPGIYFTTTNNIYTGVKRSKGAEGLESMFAENITLWSGKYQQRVPNMPLNQPTCNQAEVLYPKGVLMEHLKCIYVNSFQEASAVDSLIEIYPKYSNIECIEKPELF